jgi:mannose-6-phosphate isomerase
VPELMNNIKFKGIQPNVMKGMPLPPGEVNYPCPVEDFGISKIKLTSNESYSSKSLSLEIFVIIEGETVISGMSSVTAKKGEAIAILPGETYNISTNTNLFAYKAFVP